MPEVEDTQIVLHPKDDIDDCYCAVVLVWYKGVEGWCNSGIVVREPDPLITINKAISIATKQGIWK